VRSPWGLTEELETVTTDFEVPQLLRHDNLQDHRVLREHGCISTILGADGREFQFADGERLEVLGMCNACDANEIRKFLESR
jgi:hypothetical protein